MQIWLLLSTPLVGPGMELRCAGFAASAFTPGVIFSSNTCSPVIESGWPRCPGFSCELVIGVNEDVVCYGKEIHGLRFSTYDSVPSSTTHQVTLSK